MILSFAWTLEPLLAGNKSCTRRAWNDSYFMSWVRAYDKGQFIHQAWSMSPRAGGECVGRIRLTHRPYWERLGEMPESDLEAEGGLWDSLDDFFALFDCKPTDYVAVIRFEFLGEGEARCRSLE